MANAIKELEESAARAQAKAEESIERAMAEQQQLRDIANTAAEKLRKIQESGSAKLGAGAKVSLAMGGGDLSKFREDQLNDLRKSIRG